MNIFHALWAETNWLTFNRHEKLLRLFPNLETAWQSLTAGDLEFLGENKDSISYFFERKKAIHQKTLEEKLLKNNIQVVYFCDPTFPKKLQHISQCPVFLYMQGNWEPEHNFALAVVGTRTPTHYGKKITETFVQDLSEELTIVSGLASGVDSIAHETCVIKNRPTVAVLGSGILSLYPKSNTALAKKIVETGGVICSEFPLECQADAFHFPKRNRIISGLSLGTLVIEGKEKSGSLITADFALEHNREVFAVPGSILSAYSAGPNKLIQTGQAKLVLSANDVFEELNLSHSKQTHEAQEVFQFQNENEKKVFETLSHEGVDVTFISEKTELVPHLIASTLTLLEMKGFVENMGNGLWVKK